jgi:hypothetical protein
VTSAKKTAVKKTATKATVRKAVPAQRRPVATKKAAPVKKTATKTAAKRVVRERKLGAVVKTVVEPKPARRRRASVVKAVAAKPVEAAPQPAPTKGARPLVAKERARRKVVLPFRERLEHAIHRELKHDGPVCHPCRMNASRLAVLATQPAVVAV